jgi:hypothetical protein
MLDVAQAQCETKIEPHGLADYIRMKAMTLEGNGLHTLLFSNEFLAGGREVRVSLTVPRGGTI